GAPVAGPVAVTSRGNSTTGGSAGVLGFQNPAAPQSLGSVTLSQPGSAAPGRVAVDGSRAAVLDGVGATVLDLTEAVPPDPANAARGIVARSSASALVNAKDVAYVGNKVVVVGDSGLTVLDASTLEVLGTRTGEGAAVAVDGLAQFDL